MAPGRRRCTTLLVALVLPLLGSEQRSRGGDAKLPAFDDEVLWQDLRSAPGHDGKCSSGNLTTLVLLNLRWVLPRLAMGLRARP